MEIEVKFFASAIVYFQRDAVAGLRRRLVLTEIGALVRGVDDRRSHRGGGIRQGQQGARIWAGISFVHRLGLRGAVLPVPRREREEADQHRDEARHDFFQWPSSISPPISVCFGVLESIRRLTVRQRHQDRGYL